jgi:hypothetical protein
MATTIEKLGSGIVKITTNAGTAQAASNRLINTTNLQVTTHNNVEIRIHSLTHPDAILNLKFADITDIAGAAAPADIEAAADAIALAFEN